MKVRIIYERADDGGWGAYPPDIPGVGVVGSTRDEARELVKGAIALHLSSVGEDTVFDRDAPAELTEFVDVG